MPRIEHTALSNAELHEPKGVSSAQNGKVYVANGLGSGNWSYLPVGWGYYKDNGAGQSIGTTATKMTCNGGDGTSNTAHLPFVIRGTGNLWDTSTNKITPVASGDAYTVLLALPISAKTGAPTLLNVALDIGGGASPTNVIYEQDVNATKATPFAQYVTIPINTLAAFLTNGGQIFLKVDTGTVTVLNPAITIYMEYSGTL